MTPNSKNLKTWVEVDSRALQHNLRVVQKHVGKNVMVMAVIKSNAYGHGLLEVAKILTTYNLPARPAGGQLTTKIWFGVDSIDEALALKKAGIKNSILILGYIPHSRLAEAIRNGFRFALYDTDALTTTVRIAKQLHKKAYAHLKLETGTCRQGILPEELGAFVARLQKQQSIVVEGAYTHFADTEDASSPFYKEQFAVFQKGIALLMHAGIRPPLLHVAASAAILRYPDTHMNMVRLGISLYGLYPSKDVQSLALNKIKLKPVLTWKTRIAQIKQIPKGATVGYDRAFIALQPMKIAVLPVGYWDGYDRRLSNKGSVLIHGKKCSVVGNICMNMIMVDVTDVPRMRAGDEAVLLGKQGSAEITSEELAAKIGTINYEVVTRINSLIPRIIL
ncbi:MAG: alanine racemase [Parcubacteria group bacterium Gr01-1014_70]|nr:MAG: alanine racemase [Parcubacteria group bacterium Gr01-1014_70]